MPNTKYQSQVQVPSVDLGEEQAQVMHILDTRGLVGVMIIIILEMATPIGVLFPTDAIVFGSGLYFSGKNSIWGGIWMLMALFSVAVVLGDLLGYRRGRLLSPKLQTMQDNWVFKKKYLTMCQHYFDDYGNKTMIVSKFLPIRSIIPLVAGAILKPFIPFLLQSLVSAVLWIGSLVGISYLIIYLIPAAKNYIGLLTFLFVVVPQLISVVYMIKPMVKKYEAKIGQASDNLQHITTSMGQIGSEFAQIGSQFATIGHEVKEMVQKVVMDEAHVESAPIDPVAIQPSTSSSLDQQTPPSPDQQVPPSAPISAPAPVIMPTENQTVA